MTRDADRRRPHAVLVGAVLAVAALGIAIAVALALHQPGASPSAVRSATVTGTAPAPSPVATGTSLPVGDPTLPFGVCGSLVTSMPASSAGDPVRVVISAGTTTVASGSPLDVVAAFRVTVAAGADIGLLPDQGPTLAVVHDGVVVGLTDVYQGRLSGPTPYATGAVEIPGIRQPVTYHGSLDLSECEPGRGSSASTTARPLPAGTYALYPFAEVTNLSDVGPITSPWNDGPSPDALAKLPGARRTTVVGDPVEITITGGTGTVAPRADGDGTSVDVPGGNPQGYCGGPVSALAPTGGPVSLHVDSAPLTISRTSPLHLAAHLSYDGPGHLRGSFGATVRLWVAHDGVVVGWEEYAANNLALQASRNVDDLAHGASLDLSLDSRLTPEELTLTQCGPASNGVRRDLDPGSYLAYPVMETALDKVVLPDGTEKSFGSATEHILVAAPIALTVTR